MSRPTRELFFAAIVLSLFGFFDHDAKIAGFACALVGYICWAIDRQGSK